MEIENTKDENIWGVLGDFMEWTMDETVPALFIIILLLERVLREGIAQWGNYKVRKHDKNT